MSLYFLFYPNSLLGMSIIESKLKRSSYFEVFLDFSCLSFHLMLELQEIVIEEHYFKQLIIKKNLCSVKNQIRREGLLFLGHEIPFLIHTAVVRRCVGKSVQKLKLSHFFGFLFFQSSHHSYISFNALHSVNPFNSLKMIRC